MVERKKLKFKRFIPKDTFIINFDENHSSYIRTEKMIMTKQLDTPLYERFKESSEIATLQAAGEEVRQLRKNAFEYFINTGFPSIKNEEWRFTNVLPFLKDNYEFEVVEKELNKEELEQTTRLIVQHQNEIQSSIKGEQKGAYRIVSINGKLNKELSIFPNSKQVQILTFCEAEEEIAFQKHFGKIANIDKPENAFVALNTAFYANGIFIEIIKNTVLDKPIHFINVILADKPLLVQPRKLIVVNKSASIEIIETNITENPKQPVLVNAVCEIALEENAHFDHYDIQSGTEGIRYINRAEVAQSRHSNYANYVFTFPGADLVRNNLSIHLNAPEIESHLYGLYLTAGKQITDNHTEVLHKFPQCESNQLYKGVLMDNSKAVFNGKIKVYQDAQKTNAFQQSNNILFSEKATVNAKPQLEIYADDVKCSHGTTIGQLNNEALFYLQSRGIGIETAKNLMVNAFAFDVTEKVKIPALKVYLEKRIEQVMSN